MLCWLTALGSKKWSSAPAAIADVHTTT